MAVYRYCSRCDDVLETCKHLDGGEYVPRVAIAVAFKPGFFHAVNKRCSTKRELYETAARKGIKLYYDQDPG